MISKTSSPHLSALSVLAALALPFAVNAASVPTPKKTVAPQFAASSNEASGEVRVLVDINEYGFVTAATIEESTNTALNEATISAIHQWTFNPAEENGTAISSKAIQPFYFNRGSIVLEPKKSASDQHPVAKNRVSPSLSDELKNITGNVVLQANIDADGKVGQVSVKSSTHNELESAASAALENWSFKPAIKSGKSVASTVIVPFNFVGTGREMTIAKATSNRSVDKAPKAIRMPSPEIPSSYAKQKGEAKLELTVDEHGYVASVDVIESSNPMLSSAARDAALQWKFNPAIKNGVAVASTVIQPFSFNGGLLTSDLPVDSMPKLKRSVQPELPKALAQVHGFVKVKLQIDARGKVQNASVTKSSHDELVTPTVEAAKTWSFKPAVRDGQKVPSTVVVPFVFNERS